MTEPKPGSGNSLRDYRIEQLEKITTYHETRIKQVEEAIIRASSGDTLARYLKVGVAILAGIGALIGGVYSIVK